MDHAATTPLAPEVLEAIIPQFTDYMEMHRACIALAEKQKKRLKMPDAKLHVSSEQNHPRYI
jgi:cysteine sulfinate desulfinase/cysteine desulfurase-like protein